MIEIYVVWGDKSSLDIDLFTWSVRVFFGSYFLFVRDWLGKCCRGGISEVVREGNETKNTKKYISFYCNFCSAFVCTVWNISSELLSNIDNMKLTIWNTDMRLNFLFIRQTRVLILVWLVRALAYTSKRAAPPAGLLVLPLPLLEHLPVLVEKEICQADKHEQKLAKWSFRLFFFYFQISVSISL